LAEAAASTTAPQGLATTSESATAAAPPKDRNGRNPYTGEPITLSPKMQRVVGWVCLIALILLVFALFKSCSSDNTEGAIPTYEVVRRERTADTFFVRTVRVDAVVSGNLTVYGIERLLRKLYDEASETTGFQHGDPTHVFVRLYSSREVWESKGRPLGLMRNSGNDSPIETFIDERLLMHANAPSEIKYDLTEETRKAIFRDLIAADDRVNAYLQLIYPRPDTPGEVLDEHFRKRGQEKDRLTEVYEEQLAEKHGVTREQLDEISAEGLAKNWPMPPAPETP
jgi:hypothetical protein